MIELKQLASVIISTGLLFALTSCSSNPGSHTTATTYVAPPPHQVLTIVAKPAAPSSAQQHTEESKNPTLAFNLENGKQFRVGEAVPIEVLVSFAKLKGDGGDFRVRYIVDDEEMRWIDKREVLWLSGWTPGKHTIRIELIGPDGWPYMNGALTVTKEITVVP